MLTVINEPPVVIQAYTWVAEREVKTPQLTCPCGGVWSRESPFQLFACRHEVKTDNFLMTVAIALVFNDNILMTYVFIFLSPLRVS